jgi:hypothetical protein
VSHPLHHGAFSTLIVTSGEPQRGQRSAGCGSGGSGIHAHRWAFGLGGRKLISNERFNCARRRTDRLNRFAQQGGDPDGEYKMPDDDLKKTASDAADSVKQAAAGAADTFNTAKEQARDYAERGMEYAGDYSGQFAEFVQREPWMAMAGAFIVGYAAAKLLRSASR